MFWAFAFQHTYLDSERRTLQRAVVEPYELFFLDSILNAYLLVQDMTSKVHSRGWVRGRFHIGTRLSHQWQ